MANSGDDAYLAGLTLLARRELSVAQVRQRLQRRGFSTDAIDAAVERLKHERALDDARTAGAIARTAIALRGRGQRRVVRAIQDAGIDAATAAAAARQAYEGLDPNELLRSALAKRLRGRPAIADDREMQRLFRYLVGQGFEPGQVVAVLKSRRRTGASGDSEP